MQSLLPPQSVWVDGEETAVISVLDRGLAYGDGLFETMRYNASGIPLLARHMRRLLDSCMRMRIRVDAELIREEVDRFWRAAAARLSEGVIKLIVTRGVSARGYRCNGDMTATRVLIHSPLPAYQKEWSGDGVQVRYCDTRLGLNASLAGIKHLNRLEQVMARMEWDDPDIAEGLLADTRGRIVEGVSTNVFLVSAGRMITPPVDTCGVAGAMRQHILDDVGPRLGIPVSVAHCERATLSGSQELFLCNAVIGVWPIRQIANKTWLAGPVTRKVQRDVAHLFAA